MGPLRLTLLRRSKQLLIQNVKLYHGVIDRKLAITHLSMQGQIDHNRRLDHVIEHLEQVCAHEVRRGVLVLTQIALNRVEMLQMLVEIRVRCTQQLKLCPRRVLANAAEQFQSLAEDLLLQIWRFAHWSWFAGLLALIGIVVLALARGVKLIVAHGGFLPL